MQDALTSFEAELDRLDNFLDAAYAEDNLIRKMLGLPEFDSKLVDGLLKTVQSHSTVIRRHNFISSVIVLYGALERYVEEAVGEYVKQLVEIYQKFENLPNVLQDKHTRLSIDYLASLKHRKTRETEDLHAIVTTLNNCLTGGTSFKLNAGAFCLRSSNMKLGRIREILSNLEISLENKRILSMPTYTNYLKENVETSVEYMSDREAHAALSYVDELVTLRNHIAHGVINLEEIESKQVIRSRANALRVFASSVNEVMCRELLKCRLERGEFLEIDGRTQTYGDRILCFPLIDGHIARGDILVMQPAEKSAELRYGRIETIQIDDKDEAEVYGQCSLTVGVRVDFKVKGNGTFYIWKQS